MQSKDFEKTFSIDLVDINYAAWSSFNAPIPDFFPDKSQLLKNPIESTTDQITFLNPVSPDNRRFFLAAHRVMLQVRDNFPSRN